MPLEEYSWLLDSGLCQYENVIDTLFLEGILYWNVYLRAIGWPYFLVQPSLRGLHEYPHMRHGYLKILGDARTGQQAVSCLCSFTSKNCRFSSSLCSLTQVTGLRLADVDDSNRARSFRQAQSPELTAFRLFKKNSDRRIGMKHV